MFLNFQNRGLRKSHKGLQKLLHMQYTRTMAAILLYIDFNRSYKCFSKRLTLNSNFFETFLNKYFLLRLSNNDYGAHYHSASGANNQIVRGRYGSRNPESGRIEETTYTAGPRG